MLNEHNLPDNVRVLTMPPRLDAANVPPLKQAMANAAKDRIRSLILDFAGTEFIDSVGLSMLIGGLNVMKAQNGNLLLVGVHSGVREIFSLTRMDMVFMISPQITPKPAPPGTPWILEFVIEGAPIHIKVRLSDCATIGLSDPQAQYIPEIDLAPYKGSAKGVARVHAILDSTSSDLMIVDLGSAGGTEVNGVQIPSQQFCQLNDKDTIKVGALSLQMFVTGTPLRPISPPPGKATKR